MSKHSQAPLFDPLQPVRTTTRLETSSRKKRLNQYHRGQKIGSGKHGDVYLCTDEKDGRYDFVRSLRAQTIWELNAVGRLSKSSSGPTLATGSSC